jgi:hypothetical protein
MATKINLQQLRKEIRGLKRTQVLYRVLKEELNLQGYWKNRGRGDPIKAFQSRGRSG